MTQSKYKLSAKGFGPVTVFQSGDVILVNKQVVVINDRRPVVSAYALVWRDAFL